MPGKLATLRSPRVRDLPMGRRITALALTIVVALVLAMSGAAKVAGEEMQRQNFRDWDLPDSFRPVVGAMELALAILLVVPATRFWGGAAMLPWMLGAAGTLVRVGHSLQVVLPLVLGSLGLVAAFLLVPPGLRRRGPAHVD